MLTDALQMLADGLRMLTDGLWMPDPPDPPDPADPPDPGKMVPELALRPSLPHAPEVRMT